MHGVAEGSPTSLRPLPESSVAPRSMPRNLRTLVPEGTVPVAIGLVVTGLAAYGFLSLTRHGLGTDASTPVNQLWFATFILAPGFFLPVEQEVGRARG